MTEQLLALPNECSRQPDTVLEASARLLSLLVRIILWESYRIWVNRCFAHDENISTMKYFE
jgi:hypothetical protein